MNKIDKILYKIYDIDDLANKNCWINNIHPLIKLLLTIFYISLIITIDKYNIEIIIGMSVYPIIMFIMSDISLKEALKRISIALPFLFFMGILNLFFDKEVVLIINKIIITKGTVSMINLILKGTLTLLASYLLIATTTMEKICYAMYKLHIPHIFIVEVMFIYRYITVLLKEIIKITDAYSLRAPKQKGINYKAWGPLVGQLLLRSMDKASNIYESMCLRGYSGKFYYYNENKYNKKDFMYLIIWLVILITIRFSVLLQSIGEAFI